MAACDLDVVCVRHPTRAPVREAVLARKDRYELDGIWERCARRVPELTRARLRHAPVAGYPVGRQPVVSAHDPDHQPQRQADVVAVVEPAAERDYEVHEVRSPGRERAAEDPATAVADQRDLAAAALG